MQDVWETWAQTETGGKQLRQCARVHLAQNSVHSPSVGNGTPVCGRKICSLPEQLLTCDV